MHIATITLSLPWGGRSTAFTISTSAGDMALHRLIADLIRSYADRRGISPLSVDYSIACI